MTDRDQQWIDALKPFLNQSERAKPGYTPPFEERELHLSYQEYAELLELKARLDDFENSSRFLAAVAYRFGLDYYVHYKIVLDW